MKTFRRIILFVVVLVCGFVVGYCTGQENGKNLILGQYKLLHNDYNTKTELVNAQNAALNAADKVMDNNQLFDTDGSDAMADYLDKAAVVDSLNKLEQQALAYCSCLPFFTCGNIKNTSKLLAGEGERLQMLETISTLQYLYIQRLLMLFFFLNIQLFSYYLLKRILFTINYI